LCFRPHADSFLALAWPPGSSRHLHLPQRDWHRHGLQPALAAVVPVPARLHALSNLRRWPKRNSSHHVVDSGDVERNAAEGGIDLDRIDMIYKIWNLRRASYRPSNLVHLVNPVFLFVPKHSIRSKRQRRAELIWTGLT